MTAHKLMQIAITFIAHNIEMILQHKIQQSPTVHCRSVLNIAVKT